MLGAASQTAYPEQRDGRANTTPPHRATTSATTAPKRQKKTNEIKTIEGYNGGETGIRTFPKASYESLFYLLFSSKRLDLLTRIVEHIVEQT